MEYNKPSLSIADQIQKLKIRGLIVDDEKYAKHWLEHVSYYRLSAYYIPFEILDPSSARTHQFKRDSVFSDIIALYIFDRKLRLLMIEALERIEISIRSHWVNELTQKYGSHAHITHEPFKCPWTHLNDLTRASIPLKEQNKETFVEHYRKKYSQPFLPTLWITAETLSLGALSHWIKNTKDIHIKKQIAQAVGLPTAELLEETLHCLTPIRNVCAHHGRLWNKKFPMQVPSIKKISHSLIPNNCPDRTSHNLYNFLTVTAHMLKHINHNSSWHSRLKYSLKNLSIQNISLASMGFPPDWDSRPVWQD